MLRFGSLVARLGGRRAPRVFAAVALMLVGSLVTAVPLLATQAAPGVATPEVEVRYMETTIDHHVMAVEMGRMCVERSDIGELTEICRGIVETQLSEIAQLQTWLRDWYGVDTPPEITANSTRRNQIRMETLAAQPDERFELEVMTRFIRGHWQITAISELCTDQVYHQELFDFCRNVIVTQSEEINEFQDLLAENYGIENYGPEPDQDGGTGENEPGGLPDPSRIDREFGPRPPRLLEYPDDRVLR